MKLQQTLFAIACIIVVLAPARTGLAQSTAFTYQGRLMEETGPSEGNFDLRLSLYDALVEGNQIGITLTNLGVLVTNGVFTTSLDFGQVFDGRPLWLGIEVRKEGVEEFTILNPRQALTATPYAHYAFSVAPSAVTNLFVGPMTFTNAANSFSGDFTGRFAGDGNLLENVNAVTLDGLGPNSFWKTEGNEGTDPSTNFLGTIDDQPLELRVRNTTALRLLPARTDAAVVPTLVVGTDINVSGNNFVVGGSILGGSGHTMSFGFLGDATAYSTIGGGYGNSVVGDANNVGGGIFNELSSSGGGSTIGGGSRNSSGAYFGGHNLIAGGSRNAIRGRDTSDSTISGGSENEIGNGFGSIAETIGGGTRNFIFTSAFDGGFSTIGGGKGNSISAGKEAGTIGGGANNSINSGQGHATIAGGKDNSISGFSSRAAAIGGGTGNVIRDEHGAIAGGRENEVNGPLGAVLGGAHANARLHGQMAHAGGRFEHNGDAQASSYICRTVTTNNVETELFLDGSGRRIEIPTNSTWTFDILVTARGTNAASAGYQLRGVIQNNEGVTTFLGTPVITTLAETSEPWDATVVADEANRALAIKVSGEADSAIRWVGSVRTVEVSY